MERKHVVVSELIGNCGITHDDGQSVYGVIHPLLKDGRPISLDFQGVTFFASPFFNAAIGRLLADFTLEFLRENLKPINLSNAGRDTWHRVIENAKSYYNSTVVREAVDSVLDEQALTA